MLNKTLAVVAALLTAGVANAAPTVIDFNDGLAPGFTGQFEVFSNSVANVATTVNGTSFLSVPDSGSRSGVATYTNAAGLTHFSFDWGTPDDYNTLTFSGANGFTQSVSGANRAAGRYTYNFTTAQGVISVSFGSTTRAFEIDNVSATVPEPATWGLLLAGFAMVGVSARRRVRSLAA